MLIYNSKKEFVGIDKKDLNALGFTSLEALRQEVSDIADLFVKTPGYIHNFKHVHWIDFIACGNPGEEFQVIINIHNKSFKCKVTVETLYLSDSPSSSSFIVHLFGLRELAARELESVSADIAARPSFVSDVVEPSSEIIDDFDRVETPKTEQKVVLDDPYETPLEVDFESEDDHFDAMPEEETLTTPVSEEPLDIYDFDGDDAFIDDAAPSKSTPEPKELVTESFDNGYVYDPRVASDELGLPLDLIEEFIQDFIAQAKEFKPSIYSALDAGELDQVKILSHKLKGVAANLRIEDAFEVLSVVNTSQNSAVVMDNLDEFYKIIAKLAGEEIVVEKPALAAKEEPAQEATQVPDKAPNHDFNSDEDELYKDLLDIDFTDDTAEEDSLQIADADVPQKIDIPELADDDFVNTEVDYALENIDILEGVDSNEETQQESDEGIDYKAMQQKAAGEIGIDLESYKELFNDYIDESNTIISKIKKDISSGDFAASRYEILKLQGMSENMRITLLESDLDNLLVATKEENAAELSNSLATLSEKLEKISKAGA